MTPGATEDRTTQQRSVRTAVWCALLGLSALLYYLVNGFGPVSMAIGFFIGWPLLVVALGLYVVTVIRDLRHNRYL